MAKPEWGRKITCTSCGAKFYDMKREPAVCPSCDAENDPLVAFRPKRGAAPKPQAEKKAAPVPKPKADNDDLDEALPGIEDVDDDLEDDLDDELADDVEEDDDLIEDTADLGEDEDDLDAVREHLEPGEAVKE